MSLKHLFRFRALSRIVFSQHLAAQSRKIATSNLVLANGNNNKPSQPLFANHATTNAAENATAEQRNQYEINSNETLESLTERFDELLEDPIVNLTDADVQYSSGVLTVKLGAELGTYVLNKQTPNLQIWLSSPKSGPKRFDFLNNTWIYKRTGESLHELLSREISEGLRVQADFTTCAFGARK
jgi:frataxin